DDAQTGVKTIFTDPELAKELEANGMAFSSANSINWGRLVPQIVYYVSAYADMIKAGTISCGDKVNILVPTGNFGNILAAYYAKMMGLPVAKLICASNANNVLTDFLRTGVYDRNRPFHTTVSPSMDILISSNLERLLYHLTGGDCTRVAAWMQSLKDTGRYEVDDDVKQQLSDIFWADCCDDVQTKDEIRALFESEKYLADTHTAVGLYVYDNYVKATGDTTETVIASTASPFKFSPAVYSALDSSLAGADEFELIEKLSQLSGYAIPKPLAELKTKPVRFTLSCEKSDMHNTVKTLLGL
ncbi:MAG: threonine synthase, partial [Clostridia bacterium]|nr:threonine synthase [Clostridia bacterium]